jgi:hypothetical protein
MSARGRRKGQGINATGGSAPTARQRVGDEVWAEEEAEREAKRQRSQDLYDSVGHRIEERMRRRTGGADPTPRKNRRKG